MSDQWEYLKMAQYIPPQNLGIAGQGSFAVGVFIRYPDNHQDLVIGEQINTLELLNYLGEENWELVSKETQKDKSVTAIVFLCKRKIGDFQKRDSKNNWRKQYKVICTNFLTDKIYDFDNDYQTYHG